MFKQRFRWAHGTLQCLWKHRAAIIRGGPSGLTLIGLPQTMVFQFALTLIASLIDLMLLMSIVGTGWRIAAGRAAGDDTLLLAGFALAFIAVEVGCGWLSYRIDPREGRFPALRMLLQRFGYRQLLYMVVLRAGFAALTGSRVGWGKLHRTGSVEAPLLQAVVPLAQRRLVVPTPLSKAA